MEIEDGGWCGSRSWQIMNFHKRSERSFFVVFSCFWRKIYQKQKSHGFDLNLQVFQGKIKVSRFWTFISQVGRSVKKTSSKQIVWLTNSPTQFYLIFKSRSGDTKWRYLWLPPKRPKRNQQENWNPPSILYVLTILLLCFQSTIYRKWYCLPNCL